MPIYAYMHLYASVSVYIRYASICNCMYPHTSVVHPCLSTCTSYIPKTIKCPPNPSNIPKPMVQMCRDTADT